MATLSLQIQPTRSTRSILPAIRAAWAYIHQPSNASKYTPAERRRVQGRIRKAAASRNVELPDPDEFLELMRNVRGRKREEE